MTVPCVAKIKIANSNRIETTGNNQYFFLFFKKLKNSKIVSIKIVAPYLYH